MEGRREGWRGGSAPASFSEQRGEQPLLSRLLSPSPFEPPLAGPVLTLGLILFPSWAGAPGMGHGAPGVTNACPGPRL